VDVFVQRRRPSPPGSAPAGRAGSALQLGALSAIPEAAAAICGASPG
jgi:hypothetical protein